MQTWIERKIDRIFKEGAVNGPQGFVVTSDVKLLTATQELEAIRGKVKLILTSPPYLDVVNYARQNWIRGWMLSLFPSSKPDGLDDNLTLTTWIDFMDRATRELRSLLATDGTVVMVIGDVARSSRSVVSLGREYLRHLLHRSYFEYIGCASDHLEIGSKTTRIWGETKGRATAVDRVIIASNVTPTFKSDRLITAFDAPFLLADTDKDQFTSAALAKYAEAFAA